VCFILLCEWFAVVSRKGGVLRAAGVAWFLMCFAVQWQLLLLVCYQFFFPVFVVDFGL
jgi:hypothetical protein